MLHDPYFQHRIKLSLTGSRAPPPGHSLPATSPFPRGPPRPAVSGASAESRRIPRPIESQTLSSGKADSTGPGCATNHGPTRATPSDPLDSILQPGVEAETARLDEPPPGAPPSPANDCTFYSYPGWQGDVPQPIVPEHQAPLSTRGQRLDRHRRAPSPPSPPPAGGHGLVHPDRWPSPKSNAGLSLAAEQLSLGDPAAHGRGGAAPLSDSWSSPAALDWAHDDQASNLTALGRPIVQMPAKKGCALEFWDDEDANSYVASKSKARHARGTYRETTDRRWRKACLRCRVQKLRVSALSAEVCVCVLTDLAPECADSSQEPRAECRQCQQFSKTSKKTIHRIPCFRGKLTDVVLFRKGGLELTDRWNATTMKDVADRVDPAVMRTIHVTNGAYEEPLVLNVVRFHARAGDVMARYWCVREGDDGHEVRKKKELDTFCLVSVWDTAKYFESYIISNALPSMMRQSLSISRIRELPFAEQDVIRRTYAMAIDHYESLEVLKDALPFPSSADR